MGAKRTDAVWISKLTGEVGRNQSSTTVDRIEWQGRLQQTIPAAQPSPPSVPRGTYRLANVEMNDVGITSISNTSRPSRLFGSSSDFQVSQGSESFEVDISDGELIGARLVTTRAETTTVRNSIAWKVPTGQYDVRLRRLTDDHDDDDQIRDEVFWTVLRSIFDRAPMDPDFIAEHRIAQTAVIIKATDQLNGVVDELNGITASELKVWDAGANDWVVHATGNNAAVALEVLQGSANPEPLTDSQIDWDGFKAFSIRCNTQGFTYNGVLMGGTVDEQLIEVLSIARASRNVVDDQWTVVIDEPKTQIVQHFTPKNSRNFTGNKAFNRRPHALKMQFQNAEQGFQSDEHFVYDDGYTVANATEFESIQVRGITNPTQVWLHGRYILAVTKLRPETYTLETDVEHVACTPGDLVHVLHDVPLFGVISGRVKSRILDGSGNVEGVVVDETFNLEDGTDYSMRFRLDDMSSVIEQVVTPAGGATTDEVTFTTPMAPADAPLAGDLFMLGVTGKETVECIVKSVTDSDEHWGATLTLVDHAQPAIEGADETIPDFVTQITQQGPFSRARPPKPTVTEVKGDESALTRNADGSLQVNLTVAYELASDPGVEPAGVQIRWKKSTDEGESPSYEIRTVEVGPGKIHALSVDQGYNYDADIRTVSRLGVVSGWVNAATNFLVTGKSNPPSDVVSIAATTDDWMSNGGKVYGIHATWPDVPDLDLKRYEIRLDLSFGVDDGNLLGRPLDNQINLPITAAGTYQLHIKAQDTSENYSENATLGSITINNPNAPLNLAATTTNKVSSAANSYGISVTFDENPTDFPIARNNIYIASKRVGRTDADSIDLPVVSAGTYTVEVESEDVAGNVGARSSVQVTISNPNAPSAFVTSTTNKLDGNASSYGIRLEFTENPTDFPIAKNIVKDGNGVTLERSDNNYFTLPITTAGTYTFKVSSVDVAGNVGPEGTTSITIDPPGQPSLSQTFSGPDIKLTWGQTQENSFPIAYYDIRRGGTDYATATPIDTIQAREFKFLADWLGAETWRAAAVDVAGNYGPAGSITAQILAPAQPPSLTSKVIAIDVLLNWNAIRGTLPTNHYNVYRSDDPNAAFADATVGLQTTVDGTFASIKEDAAQDYRYWVTTVDTAGNESDPSTVRVTVNELNNFVVQGRFLDDFTGGTLTDMVLQTDGVNRILGPYDISNTVNDHYSGYSSAQDIINAGYPYALQPTRVTSGQYQNEYDIGTVLNQTQIAVAFDTAILDGDPTVSVVIEGKEASGDAYSLITNGTQAVANNVRYLRVTLNVSSNSNDDLLKISNLETTAKIQKSTSEGVVTVNAGDSDGTIGGTVVTLDKSYLDIRNVDVNVKAGNPGDQVFADWNDIQGQNQIHIFAYDGNGNRINAQVSYGVQGVVQ